MSSYNQEDLKSKILEISKLSSGRAWRALGSRVLILKDTAWQTTCADTLWNQQFEKHQGQMVRKLIFSFKSMAQRDKDHGETPPGTKGLAGTISLPYPPA